MAAPARTASRRAGALARDRRVVAARRRRRARGRAPRVRRARAARPPGRVDARPVAIDVVVASLDSRIRGGRGARVLGVRRGPRRRPRGGPRPRGVPRREPARDPPRGRHLLADPPGGARHDADLDEAPRAAAGRDADDDARRGGSGGSGPRGGRAAPAARGEQTGSRSSSGFDAAQKIKVIK